MVRTKVATGFAALVVLAPGLLLAGNNQIQELRQQIKTLTAERDRSIKHIHKLYESLIRQEKRSEKELADLRRTLTEQENQALNTATTEQERKAIHEKYDSLRRALTQDIRMDEKQISQLRASEKSHVQFVRAAYDAKIHEIQAAIKQLEASTKKPKK